MNVLFKKNQVKTTFYELLVNNTIAPINVKVLINGRKVNVKFNDFIVTKSVAPRNVKVLMLKGEKGDPGSGAITDYEDLQNLPKIEGVTLKRDKTFSDLGLEALTWSDIDGILT